AAGREAAQGSCGRTGRPLGGAAARRADAAAADAAPPGGGSAGARPAARPPRSQEAGGRLAAARIGAGGGVHAPRSAGFARELRRRLARARRVLDGVRGPRTSPAALRSFLAFARRECKLALARYLFTPEEVVERILAQVGVSRGILDPFPADRPHIDDEARLRLALLPSYEAAILNLLIGWSSTIYWVKKDTGSALNSLVEYPLGTVVLVVKPPGSELEIEIKRTGRRDGPPLSAVFVRDGREVPSWHRLDGGSIVTALHADAHAGSLLAAAFRQVHGGEPPLACTLAVASVYGVPVDGREVPILDYFTQPPDFGPGFAAMRRAMAAAVEAFERERGACLPELPGDLS